MKGRSSIGMSPGLYSMSASCTIEMSPVACSSAVRTAAPLPLLRSCRYSRTLESFAASCWSTAHDPSVLQSSTAITSRREMQGALEGQHPREARRHEMPFVVDRGQYAEAHAGCEIRLSGSRLECGT